MNVIIDPQTRLEGSSPWLSAPFNLADGKAAVITAYGMGEGDSFCVKHALIKSPSNTTHSSVECAVLKPDTAALAATTPLIKCEKPVCGDKEKPSVRLKMPGAYVLEFQGAGFAARQVTVAVDFVDASSLSDEYLACPEIDADKVAAVFMRCDGETRHVPNAQIPTCQEVDEKVEGAKDNPNPTSVARVFRDCTGEAHSPNAQIPTCQQMNEKAQESANNPNPESVARVFRDCSGRQHVPNARIPTCQQMVAGLQNIAQNAAANDIYVNGGSYNATSVRLSLTRTNGTSSDIDFSPVRSDFTQYVVNQITQGTGGSGGTPTGVSTAVAGVFQNCAGVALTPNTRIATCADLQQGLANQQDLYAVSIIDHNPTDFTLTFVRNDGSTWEANLSSVVQNAVGLFKDCNGQPLTAGAQLVSCTVFNQAVSSLTQQITNVSNNTPSQTDIFGAVVTSLEQKQNVSDAQYRRFIDAIVSGDNDQNIQGRDNGVYYGTTAPPETRVIYVDALNGDDTAPASVQDMTLNASSQPIGNDEARPVKTIKRALEIGQPNVERLIRLRNGQTHYITEGARARGGIVEFGIYGSAYATLEAAHATSGSNDIFPWTQQVRDLNTYIDAGVAFDYTYPNGDVFQFGRSISMSPGTKIKSAGVNFKGAERNSASTAAWAQYFHRLLDAEGEYEIDLRNFKWNTNSANPADYKALTPADREADGTVFMSDVEIVGSNTNAQLVPPAKPPFNFTFQNGQAPAGTLNENTIDPWVADTVKQNCVITNMVTNIPHDKLSPACAPDAIPDAADTTSGKVQLNTASTAGDASNNTDAVTAHGLAKLMEGSPNQAAHYYFNPSLTDVNEVQTAVGRALMSFLERRKGTFEYNRIINAIVSEVNGNTLEKKPDGIFHSGSSHKRIVKSQYIQFTSADETISMDSEASRFIVTKYTDYVRCTLDVLNPAEHYERVIYIRFHNRHRLNLRFTRPIAGDTSISFGVNGGSASYSLISNGSEWVRY